MAQMDSNYHVAYRKAKYKRIEITFDTELDNDIIQWLDEKEPKASFIKDIIKAEYRRAKNMKDIRDVKREYGYILRWINGGGDEGGNTWPYRFYLENIETGKKEEITNEKAIDFIKETTLPRFRENDCYDVYKKLFDILGVSNGQDR